MARGSVPTIGTRVNVQLFASDILSHQGLVTVEPHSGIDRLTVVFRDGDGARVAISGDRSSLRLILTAAMAQIPPEVAPEPPEEQSS
jgi:hypothetical protein